MIELISTLADLSRTHCVGICGFLIPLDLTLTGCTFLLLVTQRSQPIVTRCAIAACTVSVLIFLHISSWFSIGVVTPVTFILSGLGLLCLSVNLSAIYGYSQFQRYLPHMKNLVLTHLPQRVPVGKV
ncbi:hypothetical protein K4A83_18745 [Spirulina subsalsa FACHB-351]|uniref:Uncharacterized protein n=1 Tax=Spirulina subsalsa FACHB-351 TaxID=234711 RepID=A0ABT3LA10_9CYAN|nr:hypothetical protein [Spirulina subsalsa]MCW6038297.1 hypothetical protein [Spirulina subsalsa FACHB-351]